MDTSVFPIPTAYCKRKSRGAKDDASIRSRREGGSTKGKKKSILWRQPSHG
jgi:hypothetical protein